MSKRKPIRETQNTVSGQVIRKGRKLDFEVIGQGEQTVYYSLDNSGPPDPYRVTTWANQGLLRVSQPGRSGWSETFEMSVTSNSDVVNFLSTQYGIKKVVGNE